MKALYTKLAKLKTELTAISKDSTNPFYKSKYFDVNALLEHVEPLVQDNGLLLLQPIINGVVTTQIIDPDTGEKVESGIEIRIINDAQKTGGEVTYYRRYSLASLLGLQADDDDANHASNNGTDKQKEDDKPWLNQFEKDKVTPTRDWNRAVATIKEGKGIDYLRTKFKISKDSVTELTSDF